MIIDINKLNCSKCPADHLFDEERIIKNEKLRELILNNIEKINIYLLGESTPANRFVYDLTSNYKSSGLRYNLRNELVDGGSDVDLMHYLQEKNVLITDCALCPLHKLENKADQRTAATLCLKRHTFKYLDQYPNAPIITFFPSNRGYKKSELPEYDSRIIAEFNFNSLHGLKALLD
jgi:hypothetical protein